MIKSTLIIISILLILSCNTESVEYGYKPSIKINTLKQNEKIPSNMDTNSSLNDLVIHSLLSDDMYLYLISDKNIHLIDKHTRETKFILDRTTKYPSYPTEAIYGDYIYMLDSKKVKIFNRLNGILHKSFTLDINSDAVFKILVDENYLYVYGAVGNYESWYSEIHIFNKYNGNLIKSLSMPKIRLLDYRISDNYLYIWTVYGIYTNIFIYDKNTFDYDRNLSISNIGRGGEIHNDNLYILNRNKFADKYHSLLDEYHGSVLTIVNTNSNTITGTIGLYSMDGIFSLYIDDKYYYLSSIDSYMKIINKVSNKIIRTLYAKKSTVVVEDRLYFIDKNNHIQTIDISSNASILKDNYSKYLIKEVKLKHELKHELKHITLSSSGKYISYYDNKDKYIEVFNINTGKVIFKQNIKENLRINKTSLAFTPDEEYLIYMNDDSIIRFNLDTKSDNIILSFKGDYILDGLIGFQYNAVSTDSQKIIYLILNNESLEIVEKNMHTNSPSKILNTIPDSSYYPREALSPNKKYMLYYAFKNKNNLVSLEMLTTPKINIKVYKQFIFNPSSQEIAVSGYFQKKLDIYDIKGKLLKTIKNKTPINSMIYSKDGKYLLSANKDSTISIWDINSEKLIGDLKGHTNEVSFLSFDDNNRLISLDMNKNIRIWNFDSFIEDYKHNNQ